MTQKALNHLCYMVTMGICTLFCLFLTVSLLTYDAADPPSTEVWPLSPVCHNVCGLAGAYTAHWMYGVFGMGTWFILASMLLGYILLLLDCPVRNPYFRFSVWCFALASFCGVWYLAAPDFLPYLMIGSGGVVGKCSAETLAVIGKPVSIVLLSLIAILGSLYCILGVDYVPKTPFREHVRSFVSGVATLWRLLRGKDEFSADGTVTVPNIDSLAENQTPLNGTPSSSPVGFQTGMQTGSSTSSMTAEQMTAAQLAAVQTLVNPTNETHASEFPLIHTPAGGQAAADDGMTGETAPSGTPLGTTGAVSDDASSDSANSDSTSANGKAGGATEASETSGKSGKSAKGSKSKPEEIPIHLPASGKPAEGGVSTASEALVSADLQETPTEAEYVYPSLDLLDKSPDFNYDEFKEVAAKRAKELEEIVASFGFKITVREIQLGPVIAQYQVEMQAGLRVAKIANLSDDLAVKLGVPNVRVVYPLLGKQNLVGIEIPNVKKQLVRMREVIEELDGTYSKCQIPIFLGRDVAGNPLMTDLASLPHLLIAGRTGTGKSVCLNSIITSILMTRSPSDVRMLMVDPKMVELSQYKTIPHLMHPVVTDMKKAEAILAWAVEKMEDRYQWLARVGVRSIDSYNKLSFESKCRRLADQADITRDMIPQHMPYIVIVVDEMADMIMTSPKEVETHIIRLAQKSRAVGIHLILATQKPIVTVITGLIKSNLPARIAFQVSSKTDSRVVLDENGAERLLGHGDMLFLLPNTNTLVRAQGTYLSDDEITRITDSISTGETNFEEEIENAMNGQKETSITEMAKRDELYISAIDVIVREGRGSITLIQRALGIGYGRAARLIDYMETDGIVGKFAGYNRPREVLITPEQWEAMQAGEDWQELPPPQAAEETSENEEDWEYDEENPDEEESLEGYRDTAEWEDQPQDDDSEPPFDPDAPED